MYCAFCVHVHGLVKCIKYRTVHVRLQLFCNNAFHPEIDDCCLGDVSMRTITEIHMLIIDIIMDLTRVCVCVHAWVRVSVTVSWHLWYVRARVTCVCISTIFLYIVFNSYVLL